MNRKAILIGVILLIGASVIPGTTALTDKPAMATTDIIWSDNFDSYTNGQLLDGTPDDGGWKGWDNSPAAYGTVTNAQALSSPHSVEISANTDLVHEYGVSSGVCTYTAMQYIPNDFAGDSYFILLSDYEDGAGQSNTWVVQLSFNSATGNVESQWAGETMPYIKGQWIEIRCEIDLDGDWLEIYYNNMLLAEHEYSATVQGSGGGPLVIDAVDLFGNLATPVYYDDLVLEGPGQPLSCDADGPYEAMAGEDINFVGTALGGTPPYTWLWDFGNGDTSTEQNPVYAYDEAGEYTVTLTVEDSLAATATDDTTATITAPAVLEITGIAGGFGISATIKNTGTAAATNVDWTISCEGGLILVGKTKSGTITTLAAGAEETVKTGLILGFGKTTITVTANCDEGSEAEDTAAGTVLLFFVLGVS